MTPTVLSACDFLIIGAGSAGCVLANRLSASGRDQVALLEAGSDDASWLIRTPAAVGALMKHPRYNWNFTTTPQPGLENRRLPMPRGRVVGGTSSINGMVYIRGAPADFDAWSAMGNPGWSYREVLPYFIRSERNLRFAGSPYHGIDGPMNVIDIVPQNPLVSRFVAAAREIGFEERTDFNAGDMEGFGARQATIRDGRRESAATAFLDPVRRRPNLQLLPGCFVTRIIFEGTRAVGVEVVRDGQARRIMARRETVICSGAFGSPALLLHSGIGGAAGLRQLNIPVVLDQDAVGRNLQDHLSATMMMRTHKPVSYGLSLRALPQTIGWAASYLYARRGPLASNVFEAHGFVRTREHLSEPDIQVIFVPVHRNPSGFPVPFGHGYGINVALLHPQSRGQVSITSADPRMEMKIDPAFLSAAEDLSPLVYGLSLARRLLQAQPFKTFGAWEIAPGDVVRSEEALGQYVRATAGTVFHPVGTCRMAGDNSGVVDAQLRVKGIHGLRVADASVFPLLVGGNTNAAVVMVAEKASDMMLGVPAPPPLATATSEISIDSRPEHASVAG